MEAMAAIYSARLPMESQCVYVLTAMCNQICNLH